MGPRLRRWTYVAVLAVGLPGIMGVAYFWPSTIPTITAPRSAIRPPQIQEWSADWNKGQRAKRFLAKSTLSEDQVAVYRAFLKSYGAGGRERFNVGNLTPPLEIADEAFLSFPVCLDSNHVCGYSFGDRLWSYSNVRYDAH
jgi:hypothetical protein